MILLHLEHVIKSISFHSFQCFLDSYKKKFFSYLKIFIKIILEYLGFWQKSLVA